MMAQALENSWTPQQRDAIQSVGQSILVSAAAGSGKTAVLAERCAYLICDADPTCDVDQLLVVTFTESAAAEMKQRIADSLRQRIKKDSPPRLARQLARVEHASIGTVHGFCARLLRQNFHRIGLDPAFEILDPDEAILLRLEVAQDLFQKNYEEDASGDFHRLIDLYGDGSDHRLIRQVIHTHELLTSLINPDSWIEKSRADSRQAANMPLASSAMGKQLLEQIKQTLEGLARQCEDARNSISTMGRAFSGYVDQLAEFGATISHWQRVLKDDGYDMLVSEFKDFASSSVRAPNIPATTPGKELAKSLLDGVKDNLREGPLSELLAFSSQDWQQSMVQTLGAVDMFLSLVLEFGKQYRRARQSIRALDFADLERFTLDMLQTPHGPSDLARSLHEQYRHVLVDEYQDINEIQDEILRLVSRECVTAMGRGANLFCVGDVKQSIFRFRLAEPQRFLRRRDRFTRHRGGADGKAVDLRENFRSRGPLLDAVNAVFERLMTERGAEIEYDQSHRLATGRKFPAAPNVRSFTGSPIELHLVPRDLGVEAGESSEDENRDLDNTGVEAILLARRIESLFGKDGSPPMHVLKPDSMGQLVPSPIGYGDIVILLRSMQFKVDQFADVLRAHGIPVYSDAGGGFFEATEVRDMLCLLQILDNQQQDIPLAAVLRSPLAALPEADDCLARIRLAYRDAQNPVPFHQAVLRYANEQDDELAAALRDFLKRLNEWRDLANKRPAAELIWRLYEQTGYLDYCSGLEEGNQRAANLLELHRRAGQFGTFLRQGLHRFLRFLENLREEKDLGRPSAEAAPEGAVRIMSIHRSKGLEFPVVMLPDLGKRHNLSDSVGALLADRAGGLGLDVIDEPRMIRYPSLASTLVRNSLLRQTLSEELRLLYVAMTRAREHLILVGSCSDSQSEKWRKQWQNHAGPMPADVVQRATRVLDWIGPVAAMTASGKTPVFEVIPHPAEEIRTWPNPRDQRPVFSARQERLARQEMLEPAPKPDPIAQRIQTRFESAYPFAELAVQPASMSVTSLVKNAAPSNSSAESANVIPRQLDLPKFFVQVAPKPVDIGTATHLVLQHWDFAANALEMASQIDRLIDRKLISPEQARLVDRNAIAWLLETDLGKLLTAHHSGLMREIPFALASRAQGISSDDPMDQIMIRGRIDLLIPVNCKLSIVDYKTDNVSGSEIASRAETYANQMHLYRRALEQVAHQKIDSVYLVFLRPREILRS